MSKLFLYYILSRYIGGQKAINVWTSNEHQGFDNKLICFFHVMIDVNLMPF